MKFCPECGVKLVSQKFCHECGANITKYLNGDTDSSNGLGSSLNFDFSSLQSEAEEQLAKQKMLEDFEIEDGVLKKYKGKGGKVVIPKEVKIIGEKAFYWNRDIQEIIFEGNVSEICDEAFCMCGFLKKITLPNGLNRMGRDALSATGITNITFPKSLTTIGAGAFSHTKLTSVTIPKGVNFVVPLWGRGGVFAKCENLQYVEVEDGVTIIPNYMFDGCSALQSIIIPDSVVKIGSGAFTGCRSLKSIHLPQNLTAIEGRTFFECSNLISVTVPNSVTTIGVCAFELCSELRSVIIPDSVIKIESMAFARCDNLRTITIPDSVESLHQETFSLCKSMETMKIPKRFADKVYRGNSNTKVITY